MIDIVRIDHISMVAPELDPQIEILEGLFGFRVTARFGEPGYRAANLEVPGESRIGWEVLMPDGPDSYLHRFLAGASGPGLHHVAIQVDDVRDTADALRAEGVEPWGYRERGEDDDEDADAAEDERSMRRARMASRGTRGVAYIHPRGGGHGFLFQLFSGLPWYTSEAFRDEGEHTLGVKAVNHLSHAHPDREALASWYERLFGFETFHRSPGGADRAFATAVMEVPGRQMRWEIIEPSNESSFVQRFLDQRGPSIHHVTFEVEDWQRAVDACGYHQVPIFGERAGETDGVRWREAFIHPRHTGGMLVQFFWQAEPGVWI